MEFKFVLMFDLVVEDLAHVDVFEEPGFVELGESGVFGRGVGHGVAVWGLVYSSERKRETGSVEGGLTPRRGRHGYVHLGVSLGKSLL